MNAASALGPLWNGYIVLVHVTLYLAGLALLLPLLRRESPSARAALHSAALIGTLVVSALCFLPVGFWWAWLLPEAVSAPLFWIGASGVAGNRTTFSPQLLLATALYLMWMTGALFMLARLALAWAVMFVVTRRALESSDPSWRRILRDASASMGTGQVAALRFSHSVDAPAVWGFVDPTIVLPAGAHDWPPEQRRMVLLHELAHVRRGDVLIQTVGAVARALYWFHPAVLWSVRELRSLREEAADALVLRCNVKRSEYASCLLQVAGDARSRRLSGRATTMAALAMAQQGSLPRRVRRILAWAPSPQRARWIARAGVAVCGMWALTLGSVRLAPQRDVAVAALSSADWATRGYAARLLGRTRVPAIRALLNERAAHDPNPVVRRIAGYRYTRTH